MIWYSASSFSRCKSSLWTTIKIKNKKLIRIFKVLFNTAQLDWVLKFLQHFFFFYNFSIHMILRAGLLMRRNERWNTSLQEYIPQYIKRPPGRPPIRWADSLDCRNSVRPPDGRRLGVHWSTIAKDRRAWRKNWDPRAPNRSTEEQVE